MNLYALDDTTPISAAKAGKGKNYLCPECRSSVRVRSGPSRQTHFYHLARPKQCRQHQKSLEHLQLQHHLLEAIGDANLENPFPEIGRIADVAWHQRKIIFEIQCSPIDVKEAQERNRDYKSLGYEVIWILHDKKFNRNSVSAAEAFLRSSGCYFSNMNKIGEGIIYDQFEIIKRGRRLIKGPPLQVAIAKIAPIPEALPPDISLPEALLHRLRSWKWRAENDLLFRVIKEEKLSEAVRQMLAFEKKFFQKPQVNRLPFKILLASSYRALLDFLLKRLC
jgi:competence protein CoiA